MINKYILILIWIGFMGVLSRDYYEEQYDHISDTYVRRINPVLAIIVFIPIIWMAATRDWIGDTYVYYSQFLNMPSSIAEIPSYMETVTKDKGYYFCVVVLKQIIGNSKFWYFFIVAGIQGVALAKWFRKYSSNYVFSIFLFIATAEYLAWMFNGIRQFTAAIITFPAIKYLLEGKKARYIVILLIASLFHQSAIILIPLMFVIVGEAWNRKTVYVLIGVMVAIAFLARFISFTEVIIRPTQYSGYLTNTELQDDGANPIRALVYSVPSLLAWYYRGEIHKIGSEFINLCVNMSVITAALYWISVFTSGALVARLTAYTSVFSYILLPWIIENCIIEKKMVYPVTIILYLAYYYYQMHFAWTLV